MVYILAIIIGQLIGLLIVYLIFRKRFGGYKVESGYKIIEPIQTSVEKWQGIDWQRFGELFVLEMQKVEPRYCDWETFKRSFDFSKFKKEHKLTKEYIECFKIGFCNRERSC